MSSPMSAKEGMVSPTAETPLAIPEAVELRYTRAAMTTASTVASTCLLYTSRCV